MKGRSEPGRAALALAAGHLIEGAVAAHRYMSHGAVAKALGVSAPRVSALIALSGTLAPDIQAAVVDLHVGGALGALSERTLLEIVATHADWGIQRWWWSLLEQPFDPDWLSKWLPPSIRFPSDARRRRGEHALGDLPLGKLAELVARRPGRRELPAEREDLLVALADDGAPAPQPVVAMVAAMDTAALGAEYRRLYDHPPTSRHPEYLRRRVTWGMQAARQGGLPKPISGRVIELRQHLPERWREVLGCVDRVHVTRAHRVARGSAVPG